jgi:hypothetical protein
MALPPKDSCVTCPELTTKLMFKFCDADHVCEHFVIASCARAMNKRTWKESQVRPSGLFHELS